MGEYHCTGDDFFLHKHTCQAALALRQSRRVLRAGSSSSCGYTDGQEETSFSH